jgi:hypothetical protein
MFEDPGWLCCIGGLVHKGIVSQILLYPVSGYKHTRYYYMWNNNNNNNTTIRVFFQGMRCMYVGVRYRHNIPQNSRFLRKAGQLYILVVLLHRKIATYLFRDRPCLVYRLGGM